MSPASDSNSTPNLVIRAQGMAARNIVARFLERPALAGLLGLMSVLTLGITVFLIHTLLKTHALEISDALSRWPLLIWIALGFLCFSMHLTSARRAHTAAREGWMAALPQMPKAMMTWRRVQAVTIALLQSVSLIGALLIVEFATRSSTPHWGLHLFLAAAIPMVSALSSGWLARPALSGSRPHRSEFRSGKPSADAGGSVPRAWQWASYRGKRWDREARWSLAIPFVLVPVGASPLLVAVIVVIGAMLVQWQRLWSASLQVIHQASALIRAVPHQPWQFIRQLLPLVLLTGTALPAAILVLLLVLGLQPVAALLVGLALWAALMLHAACVFAWRLEPAWVTLRSSCLLVAWIILSQALIWIAPVFWLAAMNALIRRSLKIDR
ncbi:MAG: hypothetical protein AAGJ52_07315 [Pseudomonadota bacterium]